MKPLISYFIYYSGNAQPNMTRILLYLVKQTSEKAILYQKYLEETGAPYYLKTTFTTIK